MKIHTLYIYGATVGWVCWMSEGQGSSYCWIDNVNRLEKVQRFTARTKVSRSDSDLVPPMATVQRRFDWNSACFSRAPLQFDGPTSMSPQTATVVSRVAYSTNVCFFFLLDGYVWLCLCQKFEYNSCVHFWAKNLIIYLWIDFPLLSDLIKFYYNFVKQLKVLHNVINFIIWIRWCLSNEYLIVVPSRSPSLRLGSQASKQVAVSGCSHLSIWLGGSRVLVQVCSFNFSILIKIWFYLRHLIKLVTKYNRILSEFHTCCSCRWPKLGHQELIIVLLGALSFSIYIDKW